MNTLGSSCALAIPWRVHIKIPSLFTCGTASGIVIQQNLTNKICKMIYMHQMFICPLLAQCVSVYNSNLYRHLQ